MPYPTLDSLPDAVKKLPKHAQEIYQSSFNAAFKQYDGNEGKAHGTAWAAVKTQYTQNENGIWVAKEANSLHKRFQDKLRIMTEQEGHGIEDWEYLIHHLHSDPKSDEEIVHHCYLVDHLGNLFQVEHLADGKGTIGHNIVGLVEDQDVYWSNEEAEADGQKIPCANRQLGNSS